MLNGLLQRPSTLFLFSSLAVAVVMALASVELSPETELAIVAGVVAVAGLPHGAADGWIVVQNGLAKDRLSMMVFLASYIGLALLVTVIWLTFPSFCLVAFLASSAWHFGDDARIGLHPVARAATGILILSAPAAFMTSEVEDVYRILFVERPELILEAQKWFFWAAGAALLLAVAMSRSKRHALHLLETGALVSLAMLLSPLLYFGIYFCGVHASRHLGKVFAITPPRHERMFLTIVVLLTIATVVVAALIVFWLSTFGQRLDFSGYQVLFIGLAALTLPHMIIVDGLFPALTRNICNER